MPHIKQAFRVIWIVGVLASALGLIGQYDHPIPTAAAYQGDCGEAADLLPGGTGRVMAGHGASEARSIPRQSAPVDFLIPPNDTFYILGGAVCESGYHFWKVNYHGRVGWVADAALDGTRWLERVPIVVEYCNGFEIDGCFTGTDPTTATVIFVNGIANSIETHEASRAAIQELFPNANVIGIYNVGLFSSDGEDEEWIGNWGMVEWNGIADDALVALLNAYPTKSFILMGHSQGGAILSVALDRVYNPSRLTVFTFGSPATAYPEGPRYVHFTTWGDPITLVARFMPDFDFCYIQRLSVNPLANHDFGRYLEDFARFLQGETCPL